MIHMSLDVFHLIPQSQVIDMTGGRFGNMAFVVSVTREIWNSNRSPRATATRFHQFRQQDTREHTYLQANPNRRIVSKERHARPEVQGYCGGKAEPIQVSQGRKTPRLDLTSTHALSLCNKSSTLQKKSQNCLFKKCAC